MIWGLLGALGAAVCYGGASILQALAARRGTGRPRGSTRGCCSASRSRGATCSGWPSTASRSCSSIAALQTMPLFAVQAIVASFLAITAVLGAVFLEDAADPPRQGRAGRRHRRAGDGGPVGGRGQGRRRQQRRSAGASSSPPWPWACWRCRSAGSTAPRGLLRSGPSRAWASELVAVAARMLPRDRLVDTLFSDLGALLARPAPPTRWPSRPWSPCSPYSTALQRGTVTQATAPLVVGETVVPAIVGVVMLGDVPRGGMEMGRRRGVRPGGRRRPRARRSRRGGRAGGRERNRSAGRTDHHLRRTLSHIRVPRANDIARLYRVRAT